VSVEITEAQVGGIARLARLELTEAETRLFTHQLGDVIRYMEQLESLASSAERLGDALPGDAPGGMCSSVDSRSLTRGENAWRPDEPRECLSADRALANAPQSRGGFFAAPAVLDQGGSA